MPSKKERRLVPSQLHDVELTKAIRLNADGLLAAARDRLNTARALLGDGPEALVLEHDLVGAMLLAGDAEDALRKAFMRRRATVHK